MSDFVAALLVLTALAAVGNFASDGHTFGSGCLGDHRSWVKICH